ncbi:hypothetical protein PtB15_12B156 [Puccinia triticina]|nr:hypothetical protein PtB15_12B156 [Puccinia triticina]
MPRKKKNTTRNPPPDHSTLPATPTISAPTPALSIPNRGNTQTTEIAGQPQINRT